MKTRATPRPEGALLALRVQPRASRDAIVGWQDGALRVRVTAPPVDGAANAAVSVLLAEALGVPPSSISVVRGARGRDKVVRIRGLDEATLRSRVASRVDRAGGAGSHLSQATLGPNRPPRHPLP